MVLREKNAAKRFEGVWSKWVIKKAHCYGHHYDSGNQVFSMNACEYKKSFYILPVTLAKMISLRSESILVTENRWELFKCINYPAILRGKIIYKSFQCKVLSNHNYRCASVLCSDRIQMMSSRNVSEFPPFPSTLLSNWNSQIVVIF